MKTSLCHLAAAFLSLTLPLSAEPWTLIDGTIFEAQVKLVTPGIVIFIPTSGPEHPVEVSKLSEASRKRLAEVLGLVVTTPVAAIPAAVPAMPTSATTVPAASAGTAAMPPVSRDPNVIDAMDVNMIDSQYGKTATVVGVVKSVITLGSAGHKKLTFENTDFNVFISKRSLDQSQAWRLDDLTGKTIQVTGEIAKYREALQVAPREPSQLRIVE